MSGPWSGRRDASAASDLFADRIPHGRSDRWRGRLRQFVARQSVADQTSTDCCTSCKGEEFVNTGTHHVPLEAIFLIDHVVRKVEGFGHTASVVNVVERTATALHCF